MGVEIAQPFRIGPDGGILSTPDPHEQVKAHIWVIVMTRLRERLMLPDFGSTAWDQLFENVEHVEPVFLAELQVVMAKYESRAKVLDAKVSSTEEGLVEFRISYTLGGIEDQRETVVTIDAHQGRSPSGGFQSRSL